MNRCLAFLKKLRNHPVIAVLIIIASAVGGIVKLGTDLKDGVKLFETEKTDIEKAVKDLGNSSPEIRIAAVMSIGQIKGGNKLDVEKAVKVLEVFINRRAATKEVTSAGESKEIVAAISSLGNILRISDKKSLGIRKPEFHDLNLAELELPDAYLCGVTFSNTSFEDAILDRADFSDALFVDVRFARASANGARFSGAKIRASCFEEAELEGASLNNSEIFSSDFNSAVLANASLRNARFKNTRLANVNFNEADMEEVDLKSGMELTDGQVRKAKNLKMAHLPNPLYIKSRLSVCNPK